jgi:hypothetical protein
VDTVGPDEDAVEYIVDPDQQLLILNAQFFSILIGRDADQSSQCISI